MCPLKCTQNYAYLLFYQLKTLKESSKLPEKLRGRQIIPAQTLLKTVKHELSIGTSKEHYQALLSKNEQVKYKIIKLKPLVKYNVLFYRLCH
jgi:hypothetical protein